LEGRLCKLRLSVYETMNNNIFEQLVSPETGRLLKQNSHYLSTEDESEVFQIKNGIACLLQSGTLDEAQTHEIKVFDNLHIRDTSYFRASFLKKITDKIHSVLNDGSKRGRGSFVVVEMGGGEGHWARSIKKDNPNAAVFVCDLSMKTLERVPRDLKRVCADVTQPIFENGSVQVVSFWVSLHHLEAKNRKTALRRVFEALADEGLLLVFEPNNTFWPRRMMYKTRLAKDVYPDDKEQGVDFSEISETAKSIGFVEVGTYFMNPPYNPEFVKKLRRWFVYLPAVEFLYQIERWVLTPIFGDIFSEKQSKLKKYLSLYGLSIYRKGRMEREVYG